MDDANDLDDRHDPDATLHVAGMLYAGILTGRPTLLDNAAATERERGKIMRACVADAEALTEMSNGRDDEEPPPRPSAGVNALPIPAVEFLCWLRNRGPAAQTEGPGGFDPVGHSDARRQLLKAGLACWRVDVFDLTDLGRRVLGLADASGVKLDGQEDAA